ncbi:fumarate reductase flavoprotein subunit [Propionicimonas paludicola]|uniref:Fumarate reductase flavoprotein subunit n=1 Tax=Propionicimonas paludicola TaxID=185243 RepID=A0A2A9CPZ4_9ACTN|nr:FAD-dependent oxidoreductase [Propionicimonas paludicola]PFG15609.1 fumarate reductase flavoprotein subunit [Propionicimonas paludicola]
MAERETLRCQLAVIGGGAAGLMAALEATRRGLDVILLDRLDDLGGNAARAAGHAAFESVEQRNRRVSLTKEGVYQAMMELSDWNANPSLLSRFVERSAEVVDRLLELGIHYDKVIAIDPVHQLTTSHLPTGRMRAVVDVLSTELERRGVRIYRGFRAEQLEVAAGSVSAIVARNNVGAELLIQPCAALIATGGYAASPKLMRRYAGLAKTPSAGNGADTGDGLALAAMAGGHASSLIGAVLVAATTNGRPLTDDISCACVQPTLWVDGSGRRFCNEALALALYRAGDIVARLNQGFAWSIFDQSQIDKLIHSGARRGMGSAILPGTKLTKLRVQLEEDLAGGETAFRADSLEELAGLIGVELEPFINEVSQYHEACAEGVDHRFFKTHNLDPLLHPPFYALRMEATALCTTGAIEVDEFLRVLDHYGNPVGGLYAAGNDAAGPWGKTAITTIGGAPAGFALTSGLLVAEHAAGWCHRH